MIVIKIVTNNFQKTNGTNLALFSAFFAAFAIALDSLETYLKSIVKVLMVTVPKS